MTATDIAIIGAGPAGMAAATVASRSGAHVTLIDEYSRLGGQYLKSARQVSESVPTSQIEQLARALMHELAGLKVELRTPTLVWGVEGHRLALAGPAGLEQLDAGAIIIAAGARELVLPFPGWTLPGVMTLGAAQIMVKAHDTLPGQRVLLAGSGPLLLAAAKQLADSGAEVVAVIESVRPLQGLPYFPAIWGQWERLKEGWHYLRTLRHAAIPYRFGRAVVRAQGKERVTSATVARLDQHGHPFPGSEAEFAIDALCLGFGFIPNIELTQLAGCEHAFDPRKGGWTPVVDGTMQTTLAGIFAAGETAGVAGAQAAMLTGRIAGLAAASTLGFVRPEMLSRALEELAVRLQRAQRFGAVLNTLFSPPKGLSAVVTEDTLLCRCEDVPAGVVRSAIQNGARKLDALKNELRVGQGPCQGRTCGPLLARMVAEETGGAISDAGTFRIRPPVKPVPLGALAQEIEP